MNLHLKPHEKQLLRAAVQYTANARHAHASAIAQKGYKTAAGRGPSLEQIELAQRIALQYDTLLDKIAEAYDAS